MMMISIALVAVFVILFLVLRCDKTEWQRTISRVCTCVFEYKTDVVIAFLLFYVV